MKTKLKLKKTFIIYAPGVYTGGGLILLKSIINSFPKNIPLILFLDKKVLNLFDFPKNSQIYSAKKSLFSRLFLEYKLFSIVKKNDTILTFTSLPPLFKLSGHVICYHQNSILLQKTTHRIFSKKKELLFIIKRTFSYICKMNVQEYIVQTPSMKKNLKKFYGDRIKVRILPFVSRSPVLNFKKKKDGFVYISDGNDHKNHNNLLDAWSLLGKFKIKPKLFLTLDKNNKNLLSKINNLCLYENLKINNLGQVPHSKVFKIYESSQALIFPSLYESFGLPLIEATQAKLPIIASDLEYVHDVCNPNEIFDPKSPYSIMLAVKRFLNKPQSKIKIIKKNFFIKVKTLNEKDFLKKLGIQ